MINRRNLLILQIFFIIFLPISAENNLSDVYYSKTQNNIDLFIIENFETPLVYIEIAFKAGGNYQTEKNEGIFHLYEHMLFKGNSLYKNSAQMKDAMNKLGVSNYNGSTSSDYVNYFFKIPASSFEKGIEFWSAAMINPSFDYEELEREKKVVISEILSDISNTSLKAHKKVLTDFYPNSKNNFPSGNPEKVQKTTVDDLLQMQKEFYIPSNCAIFINGAIKKDEAIKTVEKYFGQWKDLSNNQKKNIEKTSTRPMYKDNHYIVQNSQYSAFLTITFKGPDTSTSLKDTFISDFFGTLLESTNNKFVRNLNTFKIDNNAQAVYNLNYEYFTSTKNGIITFGFNLNPNNSNLTQTILKIINFVTLKELTEISKNKNYFSEYQYKTSKERLSDKEILENENLDNYISFLRFYWAVSSVNDALSYYEQLNEITNEDIVNFCKDYFLNKNFITVLYINDSAFEKDVQELLNYGFKIIEE